MKNITKAEVQQPIADAATTKADALSLRLYTLTEIVRLAAFAAESRRLLKEINAVMAYRPEMQKVISEGVDTPNTWLEMEDSTGNVLSYISGQLEEVNIAFTKTVFDLAQAKTGSTDAEQIGGAA